MATFLFDKVIFGPITSRRLGQSLGINLLPVNHKLCNFNCIYCECGLNEKASGVMPQREEVTASLKKVLTDTVSNGGTIDTITFAGNGEPTLHPEFNGIIDDTYDLRNEFVPKAKIALLTNATRLQNSDVVKAFAKIDQNICKIDSVLPQTVELLNCPVGEYNIQSVIESLKNLTLNKPIIQTMFIKGCVNGRAIDNTSTREIVP